MNYREEAIEDVVAGIHRALRRPGGLAGRDAEANVGGVEAGRLFGMLLTLLGAQIRYVIQLYGLENRRDEAHRACVAGVRQALAEHRERGGNFAPLVSIHLRQSVFALAGSKEMLSAA